MAINFPTSLDNFTNPVSGNTLDSPSHSLQHSDINDAVEAMQRKVGIGTAVATSASAGQVLTISAAGTSTWSTPSSGLTLLKSATFSGASSVSFDASTFSATYDFYKVLISGVSSGDVGLSLRFRTSGTDNTTANYRHSGSFTNNAVGPTRTSSVGATFMEIGTTGDAGHSTELTFFYPFNTTYNTFVHSNNLAYYGTDQDTRFENGIFVGTTQFDSATIFPASGTFSGRYCIFGVNQ